MLIAVFVAILEVVVNVSAPAFKSGALARAPSHRTNAGLMLTAPRQRWIIKGGTAKESARNATQVALDELTQKLLRISGATQTGPHEATAQRKTCRPSPLEASPAEPSRTSPAGSNSGLATLGLGNESSTLSPSSDGRRPRPGSLLIGGNISGDGSSSVPELSVIRVFAVAPWAASRFIRSYGNGICSTCRLWVICELVIFPRCCMRYHHLRSESIPANRTLWPDLQPLESELSSSDGTLVLVIRWSEYICGVCDGCTPHIAREEVQLPAIVPQQPLQIVPTDWVFLNLPA
jgi:hypothetical protein